MAFLFHTLLIVLMLFSLPAQAQGIDMEEVLDELGRSMPVPALAELLADWEEPSFEVRSLDSNPNQQGAVSQIVIDRQGRIHVSYSAADGTNTRLRYIRRDVNGAWSAPIWVTPPEHRVGINHSMAVSNDFVFVAYFEARSQDLYSARRALWPEEPGAAWTIRPLDTAERQATSPSTSSDGRGRFLTSYYSQVTNGIKLAVYDPAANSLTFEDVIHPGTVGAAVDEAAGAVFGSHSVILSGSFLGVETAWILSKYSRGLGGTEQVVEGFCLANLEAIRERLPEPIRAIVPDARWQYSRLLPGSRFPVAETGDRFGRVFDGVFATPPILAAYCFYDQGSRAIKVARANLTRNREELVTIVSSDASARVGDDCQVTMCGAGIHVLVRKELVEGGAVTAHVIEHYTNINPAGGGDFVRREVARGSGVQEEIWRVAATCDDLGGFHATFPLRMAAGNTDSHYAYLPPLFPPFCRDLICNGGETIQSCPSDCPGSCGDGICYLLGENTLNCEADCGAFPICGNGSLELGEECDDNNRTDGDGCTAACRSQTIRGAGGEVIQGPQCGNGILETAGGEACDDGNHLWADGCSANCQTEVVPAVVVPPAGGLGPVGGGPSTGVGGTGGVGGGSGTGGSSETPTSGGGCSLILPRR